MRYKKSRGGFYSQSVKIQKFLKKYLLSKYYTIDERIKYYNYVQKHLKDIPKKSCLVPKTFVVDSQLYDGYTINDFIDLEMPIGTKSKYGVIYKTSCRNMLGRFPIASKLMEIDDKNKKEVDLNVALSEHVLKKRISRHFIFCYKSFECHEMSTTVPNIISNKHYFVTLNELANGDLYSLSKNWRIMRNDELMLNIILQCLLSIATFHKLGWIHQDCHAGNFLYHVTEETSGYYAYNILGKKYYLKNCGYNMMIYDFGLAELNDGNKPLYYEHYEKMYKDDIVPFVYDFYDYRNMIKTFENSFSKVKMNLFVDDIIENTEPNFFENEDDLIRSICSLFCDECPIKNMFVTELPANAKVVNVNPYVIDDSLANCITLPSRSPRSPAAAIRRSSRSSRSSRSLVSSRSSRSLVSLSSLSNRSLSSLSRSKS